MIKIEKIQPRDIIALVVLIFSLTLIAMKINSIVSGIVIMIVTYYFTQRSDEELHPEKDLNKRVSKVEEEIKRDPKWSYFRSRSQPNSEPPDNAKYYHNILGGTEES